MSNVTLRGQRLRKHQAIRALDTDWAYLAGLIDGEGYIATPTPQPRIVIAMATVQPLQWVLDTFGGTPYYSLHGEGKEDRFRVGFYTYDGVEVILKGCLPYLKLKRKKAEEVIRYCGNPTEQFQSQDVA